MQPGASLSEVARRYGIAARVLFRWKRELTPVFVTVEITDANAVHTTSNLFKKRTFESPICIL